MSPRAWQVVALLAVAALCVVGHVSAAATCSASDGPVSCEACREGADINTVSNLPRFNQEGASVSSNMGDFEWVSCDETTCEYWDGTMSNHSAANPANYVEGAGFYPALCFVMAPLSFLCMSCCCLWRMCGCCGGWTPTHRLKDDGNKRCCPCGFHRELNPLLAPEDKYKYSTVSVLSARVCQIVFALLIFIFIIIGQQMGNVALTDGMKRLALAPDATVATIRKMTSPGHKLVADIASGTIVPTIQDINATLLDAIDLDTLIVNVRCVGDKARAPPGLQELMGMVNTVLSLKTTVNNQDPNVRSLIVTLSGVAATVDTEAPALDAFISHLNNSRTNLTADFANLLPILGQLDPPLGTMQRLVPSVLSDLQKGSNVSNFPTTTEASDVANGADGTSTLQAVLSDSSLLSLTEVGALHAKLTAFHSELAALPDFTQTANDIDTATTTRLDVYNRDLIPPTKAALLLTEPDVERIPRSVAATVPIDTMLGALDTVNVTTIFNLVGTLNDTVNSIPSPDRFGELVEEVFGIADIIPCVENMIPTIDRVNETLVSLPDFVDDIKNMSSMVKDQINSSRTLADDAKAGIVTVKNYSDSLSGQFDDLNTMGNDFLGVRTNARSTFLTVRNQTLALDTTFKINNTVAMLDEVQLELNATNLDPDPTTLTSLRTFGGNRTQLLSFIDVVNTSLTVFYSGRCANGADCAVDSDCTTGTCVFGRKQCSDTFATCTGTVPNECGAGRYCLFEATLYTMLRELLNKYSLPSFNSTTLQSGLSSMNDKLGTSNLTKTKEDILSLLDDMQGVDLDDARQQLNDATSRTSDITDNVVSMNNTWDTVVDSTRDVPDPSKVQGQLDMLNSTVKDLEDIGDQTTAFVDVLDALKEFLYYSLPPIFADLARDRLDAAFAADGIVGTYRVVINAAKNITGFLEAQQARLDSVMSSSSNLTLTADLDKLGDDIIPKLDVLSQDKYFDNGPYYFIMSLMDTATVQPDDPLAYRVFKDINGNDYANDELCLTTTCINNEVDFVNREPLSDVMDSFEIDLPASIPLTREQATGLPFIVPGIIALLGLLGALVCCPKKSKCQRVPMCLQGCCLCFCIPLTFLFTFLPIMLVIAGGDICRGGANVGYQIIAQASTVSSVCDSLGSVSLTDPMACNISLGNSAYTQMNVPLLFEQLLGSCDGTTGVWNSVLTDVKVNFADIPAEQVNETLDGMDGGSFVMRPRIRGDVVRGAERLGVSGSNFIENVNSVLTCTELNTDFVEFKEAICCDVMSAFYWSIGAWNVLAWLMCCLGCPACMIGYKRFPRRPWGKKYDTLVRMERRRAQEKEEQDAMMMMNGGQNVQMVQVDTANVMYENTMMGQQPPNQMLMAADPQQLPTGITTPAAWGQGNAGGEFRGAGPANGKYP